MAPHARNVQTSSRVAFDAPGQRCLFCGADEPDTDDVCPSILPEGQEDWEDETGDVRHTLFSYHTKEDMGQGVGDGPAAANDGEGETWEPNSLGWGGSVGLDPPEDQILGEKSLDQRRESSATKVKIGRRALASTVRIADGGMMGGGAAANMGGPEEDGGPALDPTDRDDDAEIDSMPPPPPPPPATVHYCPFCGSGGVVGRSDGSIECSYDQQVFSVEQRPQMPFMPGNTTTPAMAEGEGDDPYADDANDTDDGNPFADDTDDEIPGADDVVDDGSAVDDADDDVPPQFQKKTAGEVVNFRGKQWEDDVPDYDPRVDLDYDNLSDEELDALERRHKRGGPWSKKSVLLTHEGVALSRTNYLRHVALAVSDDPDGTLAELRER